MQCLPHLVKNMAVDVSRGVVVQVAGAVGSSESRPLLRLGDAGNRAKKDTSF